MGLHELQGFAYEQAFIAEVEHFQDAYKGVPSDDVAAALLLQDCGRTQLLQRLHRREISTVSVVDEDTEVEDLRFRET